MPVRVLKLTVVATAVAWMLARERSAFAIEDLFESRIGGQSFATSLPAPSEQYWAAKVVPEAEKAAARKQATVLTNVSSVQRPRHRGGILAEEMGMGKTVELLGLILSHCPAGLWDQPSKRRPATLIIVPNALTGQWKKEVEEKAPSGLEVVEWPLTRSRRHPPPRATVVLATYAQATEVAASGLEFWRVCLDEPHGVLTARARSGYVEMAAEIKPCAAIKAGRRWCVTGTPFSNNMFDMVGQLCFLGLMSPDDLGRHGAPGIIPALHFRRFYENCRMSLYNSTAEINATILKPLVVRHTKTQERSGKKLLELGPCIADTTVVPATASFSAEYRAAHSRAAELRRSIRLQSNEHALRLLLWECVGLVGVLASKVALRRRGLQNRKISSMERCLNQVRLPTRDDFEARAEHISNDSLKQWRDSIDVEALHSELDCASCLGPLVSPAIPTTCGHVFCRGCLRALLGTATAADSVSREHHRILISGGREAFPEELTAFDKEHFEDLLRRTIREALPDRGRGAGPVDVTMVCNDDAPYAWFSLRSRELEDTVAEALNGTKIFGDDSLAAVEVVRMVQQLAAVPCPAAGCGERFGETDVLDLVDDVLEHPDGVPHRTAVREYIIGLALRARNERKADRAAGLSLQQGNNQRAGPTQQSAGVTGAAPNSQQEAAGGAPVPLPVPSAETIELEAKAVALRQSVSGGDFSPQLLRLLADAEEALQLAREADNAAASEVVRVEEAAAASAGAAAVAAAAAGLSGVEGPHKYKACKCTVAKAKANSERTVVFCEEMETATTLVAALKAPFGGNDPPPSLAVAGITGRTPRRQRELIVAKLDQGELVIPRGSKRVPSAAIPTAAR